MTSSDDDKIIQDLCDDLASCLAEGGEALTPEEYLKREPRLQGNAEALRRLLACEAAAVNPERRMTVEEVEQYVRRLRGFPYTGISPELLDQQEELLRRDLRPLSQTATEEGPAPNGDPPPGNPNRAVLGRSSPGNLGEPPTSQAFHNRYTILQELGQGGMGTVHKAIDNRLHRTVALKRINLDGLGYSHGATEFVAEVRMVASLLHPDIVRVHDYDQFVLEPYFTMDYLAGGSLNSAAVRVLYDNDPVRIAQWLTQIARAVHYAHEKGVLHRDLKPLNILFDDSYKPYVADFGLGLVKHPEQPFWTQAGWGIAGTLSYTSPEQARGDRELGRTVDVYGLGAVLYFMLTGRPPFPTNPPQERAEILLQVRERLPIPPSQLNLTADPKLEKICLKCLEKDPNKRFLTAEDLATELEGYVREIHDAAMLEAKRLKERADRLLYDSDMQLIQLELAAHRIVPARERLETHRNDKHHHGFEFHYLSRLCYSELAVLDTQQSLCVAFSPDGRRIAGGSGKTIHVWNAETGERERILEGHASSVMGLTFCPDGRLASASWDKTIRVWDLETGGSDQSLGHTDRVLAVAVSPDGRRLASASSDGTVRIWDGRPGGANRVPEGHDAAECSRRGVCWACSAVERVLEGHTSSVEGVAFSPDSSRLASASSDGTIRIWDSETCALERILEGHTSSVFGVAFSPEGRRLASASADGTIRIWNATSGKAERTLTGSAETIRGAAFSPDDRRIAAASADGTVRVWDAGTGRLERTLLGHTGEVWGVAFSPDGRRIAGASMDKTVRVWSAMEEQDRLLDGPGEPTFCAAASNPDGSKIVAAFKGDLLNAAVRLWTWDLGSGQSKIVGENLEIGWVHHHGFTHLVEPDGRRNLIVPGSKGLLDLVPVAPEMYEIIVRELRRRRPTSHAFSLVKGRRRWAWGFMGGGVEVWDLERGQIEHVFVDHTNEIEDLAFSPDGRRLAAVSCTGVVCLWDADVGRLEKRFHDGEIDSQTVWTPQQFVLFSPDGHRIASTPGDHSIRVWDAVTGRLEQNLGYNGVLATLAFSPDGDRIATVDVMWGVVQLWDLVTGKRVLLLDENADLRRSQVCPAPYALFFHDGRIVSICREGIRIWNAEKDPNVPNARWLVRHEREAKACETAGEWFAAAFHLQRLRDADPTNAEIATRYQTAQNHLEGSAATRSGALE